MDYRKENPLADSEMPEQKTANCARHGEYVSMCSPVPASRGLLRECWSRCPACETDAAELRAEEEARHQQKEHRRRLDSAGIPERFIGKSLGDYRATTEAQRRVLEVARDYADNFAVHLEVGRCLVLSGGVGTGKTHLGCAILQALLSHRFEMREGCAPPVGYYVLYSTASEIIRTIRATWHRKADQNEAQALSRFTRPDLLLIDEVGVQMGSDSERAQLGELVDLRYRAMVPSLVITNCDKADLTHYLGERAVDRLRDNGGLMAVCNWTSYRATVPELRNSGTREIGGGKAQ
jgi:DNA replication protein DnaC